MKTFIQRICFVVAVSLFMTGTAYAQGFLIPKNRTLKPLSLEYQRVNVKLKDRAAKTTVTQVFVNRTNRLLEATYIFPIPKGATVSNFVLYINGKATKGHILERTRANSIYQSIVRRMQDPGLIEHMGGRLFRARVYPIPRKGKQKLKISFTQVVPYQGGMHRFVYPLRSKQYKRYRTDKDFTLSVQLKSKTPIKNIYSPSHNISVARKGEKKAVIGFEKNKAILNKDFVLYYSVSPKDLGMNLITYREKGQDGYFLMMATPKTSYSSKELVGKNITFVLDTSGSMSGAKMKWARIALEACLKKLNPKDHFNVIRFSTDVEALFTSLQPANAKKVKEAVTFVKKMQAAGGTAINEALKKALSQKPKGKGVSLVVFLTDGHPTIGETEPKLILKNSSTTNKYKAKVYTFGIGTSINTKLLDLVAQKSGATGDYVKPNKEIRKHIASFYDKVRYPVLSDIKMKVTSKIRLYDIYPKRLPDLFRGGQILVFGRYRGEGHAAVTLTGKVNGKVKKFVYESKFKKKNGENDFITRLWANRKIAYLLDNIRLHGEKAELKTEIIRLSKKFGIVTPYTSYLVVDKGDLWRIHGRRPIRRLPGRPIIQPSRPSGLKRPLRRKSAQNFGGSYDITPKAKPMKSADLKKESGKGAVEASRRITRMKKVKVVRSGYATRYIKGKLFLVKGGKWVDQSYRSSMKVLRIKYLSKMYFKIIQLRPDLAKYLSLGGKLIITVNKKRAIIIGATQDKVTLKKLRAFLKK